MTLILKLDLDMVKTYLHTKNEVSIWSGSKVIAWTTERNTDTQTQRHDWRLTYPHTHVVTRMHCSMMHTGHSLTICQSLLLGGCLLLGGVCSRGCLLLGVCLLQGGCLLWGVSAPGGCVCSWQCVCFGGCVYSGGVSALGGVSAPGGVSALGPVGSWGVWGCLLWGCLLWGVCVCSGGCLLWGWEVSALGGCLLWGGVCSQRGVSAPGRDGGMSAPRSGVSALGVVSAPAWVWWYPSMHWGRHPPPRGQNHTCTSLRSVKIMKKNWKFNFKNLEKSWKSHGILWVRKSGNPGCETCGEELKMAIIFIGVSKGSARDAPDSIFFSFSCSFSEKITKIIGLRLHLWGYILHYGSSLK